MVEFSSLKDVLRKRGVFLKLSESKSVQPIFQSVFQPKTEIRLTNFVCGIEIKSSDVQFSLEKTQNYLLSLPINTTTAFDGTSPPILTKAVHTFSPFVHLGFTYITRSQIWPENWKCAYVTPIHKKGPRADVENYWPISLLPRLSLVLEILFLFIYPKIKNRLNPRLHGFRANILQLPNCTCFCMSYI